jgi:copper transport protein
MPTGSVAKCEQRVVRRLAAITLCTSAGYMIGSAADMMESWAAGDLWLAMSHSVFGHLWCVRVALLLGALFLARDETPSKSKWIVMFTVALGVLLTSSLSGHAGAQEEWMQARVAVDWTHSIAVAAWAGGLFSLRRWLSGWLDNIEALPRGAGSAYQLVQRFSHLAMGSTGSIGVTGILMTYWAGVSFIRPWESTYGLLICAKLALFSAALLAAAINQFLHLRRYDPTREAFFARAIRREVTLELVCVTVIFGVAGFLARTALAH